MNIELILEESIIGVIEFGNVTIATVGTSDHAQLTNRDIADQHPISSITGLETALNDKEPLRGADDNYVTDAQLVVISNTSGTNTGDQDLSGLQPKEIGKGLSANDYTDAEKVLVATIPNKAETSSVPTKLSDLDKDINFDERYYTETETDLLLNGKEPTIIVSETPSANKYLNELKQFSEIVVGSGGYSANIYLSNSNSTVVGGYKILSYTPDYVSTEKSIIANNGETAGEVYLYEQPIGLTTIDAGSWIGNLFSSVSSVAGDSYIRVEVFTRAAGGLETTLFTTSLLLNNTSNQYNRLQIVEPIYTVLATDRIGIRVFASTTRSLDTTINYTIGDGNASYFTTPLALRHPQLRGLNDDPNNQHITSTQVSGLHTHSNKSALDIVINTGDGSQYLANDGTYKTIAGGLTNWTESNYLYSTKYGVKFTPNSAQTNVDVVLQPKGTGAILAQQPDGTAIGGNNRGVNAVDLQTARTANSHVASGVNSVVAGGYGNNSSGGYSIIAGGANNRSLADYSVVCGGGSNTASGSYSVVSGGAINTASGVYSAISGGYSNTASGTYSVAMGLGSKADKQGQIAHSSGTIDYIIGDCQTSELLLRKQTTNETPTELFLDGTASRLTLVNNSILSCDVMIMGKKSGSVDGYKYNRRVLIAKGTTAASTTLLGTVETIGTDYEADEGAGVEITADTTNGSLKIMVTGLAGTTINWMAKVTNIELVKA